MIVKTDADGSIRLRDIATGREHRIPVGDLRVGAIAVDPTAQLLAASALEPGGKAQSPLRETATRGDYRLFVTSLDQPSWRRVDKGLSLDPFWIPGSQAIAYAGRSGPAVLDLISGAIRRQRVGAFGWGAPSISVNADGSRVAFINWRGDSRVLGAWDLRVDTVTIYRASCYGYSWWDSGSLLYQLGGDPKILDLASGDSRRWAGSAAMVDAATSAAEDALDAISADWQVRPKPGSLRRVKPSLGIPRRIGDRVFFDAGYALPDPAGYLGYVRHRGLFSVRPDLSDSQLHGWFEAEAPASFAIVDEGLYWAYWHSTPEKPRHARFFGPRSDGIDETWQPLPSRPLPSFADHFFRW